MCIRDSVGSIFEDGSGDGLDPVDNNDATGAGAAYSYRRTGTTWAELHFIKAFNSDAGDHFGAAVAMSRDGSIYAIGAPVEASSATGVNNTPNESLPGAGAVYVSR